MTLSRVMTVYKIIVTIPGQVISWYTTEPINFEAPLSFPNNSSGYVIRLSIPRDCDVEDLVKCLNGVAVDSFEEHIVATLSEGNRWISTNRLSPNIQDVADAVLEELRND